MKTQLEKLQEVLDLMKQAEGIIDELQENEFDSLNSYHGYGLKVIGQELNRFSDNSCGYLGRNTNIYEIIDHEGEVWDSEEMK